MTREELNAKNKADLLALATAANLAATPAMTKGDLVELLLANAQLNAATAPGASASAPETVQAPAVAATDPNAAVLAEMAAMREQMGKLMALNQAQAAELATARADAAKAADLATDKLVADNGEGLPKEGALRALDGSLASSGKMRVTVMATESEKEDVKLGVNGHLIIIKRGLPVVIDAAYVEVLRNSTIDTVAQDPDTGVKVAVKMQRYPFTAEPA
jgi:hypothetical protein